MQEELRLQKIKSKTFKDPQFLKESIKRKILTICTITLGTFMLFFSSLHFSLCCRSEAIPDMHFSLLYKKRSSLKANLNTEFQLEIHKIKHKKDNHRDTQTKLKSQTQTQKYFETKRTNELTFFRFVQLRYILQNMHTQKF